MSNPTNPPTPKPVYLWAAIGDRSAIPDRLEVTSCPVCVCLVSAAGRDAHLSWHRTADLRR